jgi:hypothetical protein
MKRGRFIDRVECLEYVGNILHEAGHEKGAEYLKIAIVLQLNQKKDNKTLSF